jgi:Putative adhesin
LFDAQRFCRSCGAPTHQLSEEQVPTRMMPPQPEGRGARSGASTAPTSRPETTPVYDPSAGYQPTVPPYPSVVPQYAPPRSRSPVGWILAFIGAGLFVVVVLAVMFMARAGRRAITEISSGPTSPPVVQPGESVLSADNADQSATTGTETTLTKTFALGDHAKFSIKNINGSITVEAWDQPKAEVRVIKRGSDRGAQVIFSFSANNLALRTGVPRNSGKQDIRYEVKIPREMGRVDLNSVNGSIKLSSVSGQIVLESTNGNIELTDVAGVSKAQTTNGRITAVLEEATEGQMEFTAVNGHIFITIKSDFDANLEASTVHGSIDIDDQFGIPVERQIVGQHARGQIGSGGSTLRITTVNGGIKLAKQ